MASSSLCGPLDEVSLRNEVETANRKVVGFDGFSTELLRVVWLIHNRTLFRKVQDVIATTRRGGGVLKTAKGGQHRARHRMITEALLESDYGTECGTGP